MTSIVHLELGKKSLLQAAIALVSLALVLGLIAIVGQSNDVDVHGPSGENSPVSQEGVLIALHLARQADPRELFPAGSESRRARLFEDLQAFYAARGYAAAWVEGGEARPAARELIRTLQAASRHGLDPADYRSEALAEIAAERFPMPFDLIGLDIGLTAAFLLYADHLGRGRIEPADLAGAWHLEVAAVDPAAVLTRALAEERVAAALDELAPGNEAYGGLLSMLARYRALAEAGGWPVVPAGPTIKPGEDADGERLRALAARLRAEGDLGGEEAGELEARWRAAAPSFDATLAAAVARFQSRHGLTADGKVGRATLDALNVPASRRRLQIELNLERRRWLAAMDFPERYIHVNVPEYRLRGYDGGHPVIDMKVVVGKEDWQTPTFADAIRYLEVNPYWTVPAGIAYQELIPAIRQDPGYLAREDMEVIARRSDAPDPATIDWWQVSAENFPYAIRQRPGPRNALGQVKFGLSNPFAVYLHDTPAQSAFQRERRALSHGCVRVERPLDLARYVLAREPASTHADVAAALAGRARRQIRLGEPLPVYVLYATAFQDADGVAHFWDDVYGHDRALAAALGHDGRS